MMNPFNAIKLRAGCFATGLLCATLTLPAGAAFLDPLDLPARPMENLQSRPLQAVAKAGERLVAVGLRGLIMTSDDHGKTWQQSTVPVQDDLVAVRFPTATDGWVVGHDGVILHSQDAGQTWEKQFDGRAAKDLFTRHYQPLADSGDADAQAALALIERNYKVGPALPLLDLWFEDAQQGYAVGSFGMLLKTLDGGRTWLPWLEHIDNPDVLNLNAITGINGQLYIAAESGTVYRLNRATQRFDTLATGYDGSFFGLACQGQTVLAFGLVGTVYRSEDQGDTWAPLDTPSEAIITAGLALPDGQQFVLVNAAGDLLTGNQQGPAMALHKTARPARYTGILALGDGRFLMSSLEGIRTETPSDSTAQR